MEDYSEGQDPGVNDVSSADLQSTIPDIGMTHPSQLAAWSQAHAADDGQYAGFHAGPGSHGVVYDPQVTDIVQQAYLQSALVQSDPTTDKFNPYHMETGLDKSCVQVDDSGNFSRSVDSDRRNYDMLRSKGLEIVHTVVLDEQTAKSLPPQQIHHHHQLEQSYRHMPKPVSEPLPMFDNSHSLNQDPIKEMQLPPKTAMTEYGRVLLKHQQNQYISHGTGTTFMTSSPKLSNNDMQMKPMSNISNVPVNVSKPIEKVNTAPPKPSQLNLEEEVDLFDQEWGDQTRLLLFNLMTEHKLCDAAITTGKYTIKLHKLVLAMSSERFASYLSTEADTKYANISVPIHISETTLKVFVTFLYLGKVRVTLGVVKEIKVLSKIFEIHNLEHLCYGIMVKNNMPTYIGSWPKLKVSFASDMTSKRDQSVGTEECYFKAMSEIAKVPLLGRGRGRPKRGPKQRVPKALPKAAGHRYGTRGASASVAPAPEPEDIFKDADSDSEDVSEMPTVKQGPKGRFRARNAAKAKKKGKFDKDMEISQVLLEEKKNEVNQANMLKAGSSYDIMLDMMETGIGCISEEQPEMHNGDKTILKVSSLPVPTLRGRKQKLLQSVELDKMESNNTVPYVTDPLTSDASIIVTPSMPSMNSIGATSNNKADTNLLMHGNNSVAAPVPSNFHGKDNSVDAFTAMKKSKKGRARRPLPTHVAVRPPPKKRAKMELNRLTRENDEDDDYDLPMIFLSPSPSPAKELEKPAPPRITKPKPKKRKRWPKADITSQLASELEKMADYIEEGERQYKCELCGNEFVFPKRSVTHLLNTHQVAVDEVIANVLIRRRESSPKVCDICGYKTKDPNFYYIHYHKYFRHGVPLPQGWKPFTCDICGKECFTKFQLKDHKLIHQEDTPFVCEMCGQGFKSRTCLNSHVFHRHSDERKHSCPDCQKTFKTKTQRLVHMRTHTGEKPFSCPDCPYKSTTRGNMRLHLCNKHKYEVEKIKAIMFQLKTLESAFDAQKLYMETANVEHPVHAVMHPPAADTSGLADTSLNVSDTTLNPGEVPLTLTTTAALDRAVNVIAAEHAMHAILLPLSTTDTTSQSITTYSVESTIPLTTITENHVPEPQQSSSSPALSPHRQHAIPSNPTHFYMQHSPISPPPPSDSPHTPYQTTTSLQQAVSPLNLQAAQVVTTTLNPVSLPQATTPDSTQNYETVVTAAGNQQPYDAAMIQAYYQQQFYPHGY